jgi:chromosome segregation ATPase
MPRTSFSENMARWELLRQGLAANAADLAFLSAEQAQLTSLLTDLRSLDARQENLKAQLQQVTQELEGKVAQAGELESRLRASLKGKYGGRNEKLEEFGIKPPRPSSRKRPAAS